MPVKHPHIIGGQRGGYIFLVSVLVIGAIAAATSISLLLLGWAAEQNGLLIVRTVQAFEHAMTCAERTIRELRIDPGYAGEETITLTNGSCEIETIGGSGNEDRTICITGHSGESTRRLELNLDQLFPFVKVRSWQEVSIFTQCP